ncbi:unnamed protein product, partial [Effrenium voratum]
EHSASPGDRASHDASPLQQTASFPDAFRPGTLYADARLQFQEPSSMWGMPAGNGVSEVNSYKASPCARSSAAPTLGARPHVRNAVQDAAAAAAWSATMPGGSASPVMKLRSLQPKAKSISLAERRARINRVEEGLEGRRRRQPSQSSSSGSQAASDSETGGSCRTRAFLAELKEEQPWTSVIDEEEPQLGEFESGVLPLRSVQESPGMDRSRTESRQASKGESDLAGRMVSPSTPQRALRTDTLSVAGSYCPSMAPSIAPSPHPMAAMLRQDSLMPGGSLNFSTFHSYGEDTDKDRLSVRILNGVSGEEEIRFSAPLQADSEQQFLAALDRLCLQHAGQPLAGLNWLSREGEADRFQRRTCDVRMIEELFDQWTRAKDTAKGAVVLLCTIPVQPPSELPRGKVRLKGVEPMRVSCVPQVLRLDTSALEAGLIAWPSRISGVT